MRKRFEFGKVDYYHRGAKDNAVSVDVTLKENHNYLEDKDYMEFTACGYIWNRLRTDCIAGGQCLDTIAKYLPKDKLFQQIYTFWKKYHLNGMHSGTVEQEKAINEYLEKNNKKYDYTEVCDYLKSINLFEVEYNGKPYKYGHSWICQEIPKEDLDLMEMLIQA